MSSFGVRAHSPKGLSALGFFYRIACRLVVGQVGVRLQKTLTLISKLEGEGFQANADRHSQEALARAVAALVIPADVERLKRAALASEVRGQ
ncbi:hypothetical protein J2T09_005437 [Neorhizobium huautlense]|uniref:Uncharacterized protein n=1 Tax=Neorhizobium huautlense TaxID=67774 RepID=A0ABT9Q3I8_9HYPH|nr:hypothetical protein [Neorhizobium huautlense]